jgi:ABC-type branched-subunit amino acid transport system permease subunit
LIVGVVLVVFITVAPNGIIGFVKELREKRR